MAREDSTVPGDLFFLDQGDINRVTRFATMATNAPFVVNLQYVFWRQAMEAYDELRSQRSKASMNVFYQLACLAIADAGTSVSILLGQNCEYDRVKPQTPSPGAMALQLPERMRTAVEDLLNLAADIRHFGSHEKAKRVLEITPDHVCECLEAAKDTWIQILDSEGQDVSEFRQCAFSAQEIDAGHPGRAEGDEVTP